MEKDLNHQGRQGEDRGDGIRRRPKEERQQTARRRPVERVKRRQDNVARKMTEEDRVQIAESKIQMQKIRKRKERHLMLARQRF